MGNKGSNTTTSNAYGTTTTAANDEAQRAYEDVMRRATAAANTPYQAYTGEEVAPIDAQQTAGIGTINQAAGRIGAAGARLSTDDINRYMNPYTNDVVNATQADFDVQNQRANSTVTGNAAAQGALGGDRVGVAQALTQESQNRAQAPIIAGLRSSAYNSGLGAAEHEQQYRLNSAQALMGAGQSQVGAGTLQQQTQQAQDTQKRQDYYQAQGYDFQTAQWLAGIDTGVGSQMGGTSTNSTHGTTEGPTPNTFAQIAGLGIAGASLFANRGGRVEADRARGGGVAGFASGGLPTPYANDFQSWVPQTGLTAGHGAPSPPQVHAPEAPKDQSMSPEQIMKGVGGLGKAFGNSKYGDATSDYMQDLADGDAGSFSTYFARGGGVKRYASGGSPGGGLPWLDDASAGWYAPDLIPTVAGFGASTPAVQSRSEEPADIPGQFRLDEQAHRDWQGRVDRDTGRARTNAAIQQGEPLPDLKPRPVGEVMLAQDNNGRTDPGLGPRGNPRPISAEDDMANAIHDGTVPAGDGSALGYAPEPRRGVGAPRPSPTPPAPDQQQPEGSGGILGGLGIHLTPELRQGLLMAGLSMMSTRRGGPGSFLGALGEGGISGVASYEKTLESARKQEAEQRKEDFERMKFERPFEQQTANQIAEGQRADRPYSQMTAAQKAANEIALKNSDKENWTPVGETKAPDGTIHPVLYNHADGSVKDAYTGKVPDDASKFVPKGNKEASLTDADAAAIARYTVATGDDSRVRSLGFNPLNKSKIQSFITREMDDKKVSDEEMASRKQDFSANGISKNAAARTRATREENLDMVLRAANAAIPAALEESEKVQRYSGIVPLDRIIQHGQIVTNDPNLVKFGMANLQLAEHWARAMNPMGVMRESDRDLALHYLDTAFSKNTYREAIMQLQKQVTRERDAIHQGKTTIPKSGQAEPGQVGEPHDESGGSSATGPSPSDKQALDWANANPNDPRAAKIKAKLGVQ